MNAVIALCNFCELHGPSILFCTQAFHDSEESVWVEDSIIGNKAEVATKSWYGPSFLFQRSSVTTLASETSPPTSGTCEGCTSMSKEKRGFISNDHEARVSYVSSQYPLHPDVFSAVRQACVRSLSCEVCPGREGPIFFGEENRGHVLSHTFFLADSQARGFHSWYSIIVIMRDKIFLLNSWPFLVKNLQKIIHELQEKANKVFAAEQSETNQRAVRLNSVTTRITLDTFRRQRGNVKARSIRDLTSDKEIFSYLHDWFTWILCTGARRMTEQLVEGYPSEDTVVDLERQEETEEGFIKVHIKKISNDDYTQSSVPADEKEPNSVEEANGPDEKDIAGIGVTFSSIRELFHALGKEKFHCLAYHTIVGNQIIIKGRCLSLMKSLITCLQDLLPKGCFHPIYYSVSYEDSWKCNFLGILPEVSIPDHVISSELHIQINIIKKEGDEDIKKLNSFEFIFHTTAHLPDKMPQMLCEMERAISDSSFSLDALDSFLFTLKEIWMNKVKMLFAYSRGGKHSEAGTTKLLEVLGAQEQDKQVLKFWMTGLSTQYKTRVLSSLMQQGKQPV